MDLQLQLQELRLKALESLKRSREPEFSAKIKSNSPELISIANISKEEGEISDVEEKEAEQFEQNINHPMRAEPFRHSPVNRMKKNKYIGGESVFSKSNVNNNVSHFRAARKSGRHSLSSNKWTREDIHPSPIDFVFDTTRDLKSVKNDLLERLDVNRSIHAAAEYTEQDLLDQLRECENLQVKCERERLILERHLDVLNGLILEETTKDDRKDLAKVSADSPDSFKKSIVGRMLKDTYMRSLNRFPSSRLFAMYCEILGLDGASREVYGMHDRIDAGLPYCLTELYDGVCPFRRKTCTFQHFPDDFLG